MPMSGADGGGTLINEETKRKAMARLNRIEGQVQGVQRMVEEEKYCVDILLQISAIQGALEQVRKILLGRHIESCVAEAMASGRAGQRQKKIEELLEVFSRYGR
jgi:DNA-binding FrmR family transcriptional regulator